MNVKIVTERGELSSKPIDRKVDLRGFWYEYLHMINMSSHDLSLSEISFLSELLSRGAEGSILKRGVLKDVSLKLKVKQSYLTSLKISLLSKGYLQKINNKIRPEDRLHKLQKVLESQAVEKVIVTLNYDIL